MPLGLLLALGRQRPPSGLSLSVTADGTGVMTATASGFYAPFRMYVDGLGTMSKDPFVVPVIAGVPTISGTETEGETLTATAASVTGTPAPVRTWQWERDGTPIAGATSSTYTLAAADVGAVITVVQTETSAAGVDTAESAGTGAIAAPAGAPTEMLTSFTHTATGVTWTFSEAVPVGTYWNGDPFVVAGGNDITITQITPEWSGAGRIMHGTMVQPGAINQQSFDDSITWGGTLFTPAANDDPAYTGSPIVIDAATYPGGASIVKAVSLADLATQRDRQHIDKYCVLTVVPSAPPVNAFRPPVVGTNKSTTWTTDDLDYTILQSVTPVSGQAPIENFAFFKEATFVSWFWGSEETRYLHPNSYHDGYNDYQLDGYIIPAIMALNSDYTNLEKADLFAGLVQQGIDYCGYTVEQNRWLSSSTHIQMFPPIMALAVRALGDDTYLGGAFSVAKDDEDFFYVTADMVGVEYFSFTSSEDPSFETYTADQIGLPDWRITDANPDPSLFSAYRMINGDNAPILALLMDMIGARSTIANSPFFDYSERMRTTLAISPDLDLGSTVHVQTQVWTDFLAAYHGAYYAGSALNFRPEQPYGLDLVVTGDEIAVTITGAVWPGSSPVTRVDMRIKPAGGSWTEVQDTGMSHTFTGLTEGTIYFVQARYVNAFGAGPWSYNRFNSGNTALSTYMLDSGLITQAEVDAAGGTLTLYRQTQAYEDHCRAIWNCDPGYEVHTLARIMGVAEADAAISAQVALVGTSGGEILTGGAGTISLPVGAQEGDYALVVIGSDGTMYSASVMPSAEQTFMTDEGSVPGHAILGRFVTASDGGIFVDAASGTLSSRPLSVFVAVFRGVANPPSSVATQTVLGTSNATQPPAITPTMAGQGVIIAYVIDDYNVTNVINVPTGFTDLGAQGTPSEGSGNAASSGVLWRLATDIITITPDTALWNASLVDSIAIATIVLDPA